jgi:hypothetical protein
LHFSNHYRVLGRSLVDGEKAGSFYLLIRNTSSAYDPPMKSIGIVVACIGAALFAFSAFGFDTSVHAVSFSAGDGSSSFSTFGRRVVNLDLQQRQLLLALAGCSLFVAGVIIAVAGEIVSQFEPRLAAPPAIGSGSSTPGPSIVEEGDDEQAIRAGQDDDEPDLMRKHGITHEGDQYVYGRFRYDRLVDAIAYAKREAARG